MKLTIEQLNQLLKVNGKLLKEANDKQDTKRMHELLTHRAMVKDMLIEALEFELELAMNHRKAA